MRNLRVLLCFLLCIAAQISSAFAGILPSGGILGPNQVVYSNNGKYYIVEQASDGNFVVYRSADGSVRWTSNTPSGSGSYLAMQASDGNLVQYLPDGITPVWWTGTAGWPGAYLSVEDDGNLIVKSSSGLRLWDIGEDPLGLPPLPPEAGDVPGRDMNQVGPFGPFLGHLGIWSGSAVYEVTNTTPNAAAVVDWATFNSAGRPGYWGPAHAAIPDHWIYYCFGYECPYSAGASSHPVRARQAVVDRARQIMIIGASYSWGSAFTPALADQKDGWGPRRGSYRCDTYVIDAYQHSAMWNFGYYVPPAWFSRMDSLENGWTVRTPANVWTYINNS